MLTRVEIKEFRSCHNVVLDDLSPVTALVGRNGAGKSNILQAIQSAAHTATITSSLDSEDFPEHARVLLAFQIEGAHYRYEIGTQHQRESSFTVVLSLLERLDVSTDDRRWRKVFERTDEKVDVNGRDAPIQIDGITPCMAALRSLVPEQDDVRRHIGPVHNFLDEIAYFPFDETSTSTELPFVHGSKYTLWRSVYDRTGTPGDSLQMRLFHLFLEHNERYHELLSLLGPKGIHLLDTIRMPDQKPGELSAKLNANFIFSPGYSPAGTFASRPQGFELNQLSVGTRRVLRMVTAMLLQPQSVMLFEHPEDTVHPGLLRKLIALFKTYGDPTQFVFSSHSPTTFDCLDPADVRLVTMADGQTDVRKMDDKELAAAKSFLRDEGSLSEFLETLEEV